ncbi:MAG: phasin family protein [Hyphomicrobiaceae bacterium]|nr:phasin family protein [Hyphomicrobiaceae bacterium]
MNDSFTRQAEQMFNAANGVKMPENVQAMLTDGVAKTREAYEKAAAVAKDQAKVAEELMLGAQASAKTIGSKLIENTVVNTDAAFDAAQAIARARSLPEAARLQAEFMQRQMAIAGAQTRELFELSSRVAQQTLETMNAVATKSFDQMKKG